MRITGLLLLLAVAPNVGATDLLLVGNKEADTVSLIDTATGVTIKSLPTGVGPHEIAVAGTTAVVTNYGKRSDGNSLTIIDLKQQRVVDTMDLGRHSGPHGIEFLKDGVRAVVTAEGSGHLLIVDIPKREILTAIATRQAVSHMVALAPDETRAYVANIGSGSISVIDLQSRHLVRNVTTGEGTEGIAVTADGSEVWVSNRADNTISVVNAKSLKIEATLPSADFPIRVEMHGDHALVTNAKSGDLVVFDRKSRREVKRFPLVANDSKMSSRFFKMRGSLPIGIQGDGDRVYVALAGGDRVAVLDARTWSVTDYWETGAEPDAMAIARLPEAQSRKSWVGMKIADVMASERKSPQIMRDPEGLPVYTWKQGKCSRSANVNRDGLVVSVYRSGCD